MKIFLKNLTKSPSPTHPPSPTSVLRPQPFTLKFMLKTFSLPPPPIHRRPNDVSSPYQVRPWTVLVRCWYGVDTSLIAGYQPKKTFFNTLLPTERFFKVVFKRFSYICTHIKNHETHTITCHTEDYVSPC